jgi:hypothetical protein
MRSNPLHHPNSVQPYVVVFVALIN